MFVFEISFSHVFTCLWGCSVAVCCIHAGLTEVCHHVWLLCGHRESSSSHQALVAITLPSSHCPCLSAALLEALPDQVVSVTTSLWSPLSPPPSTPPSLLVGNHACHGSITHWFCPSGHQSQQVVRTCDSGHTCSVSTLSTGLTPRYVGDKA